MARRCARYSRELQMYCGRGYSACPAGYACPRHDKDLAYRPGGFLGSGSTGFWSLPQMRNTNGKLRPLRWPPRTQPITSVSSLAGRLPRMAAIGNR